MDRPSPPTTAAVPEILAAWRRRRPPRHVQPGCPRDACAARLAEEPQREAEGAVGADIEAHPHQRLPAAWRVGPRGALAGVIVGGPAVSDHRFPSVWGSPTAAASSTDEQNSAARGAATPGLAGGVVAGMAALHQSNIGPPRRFRKGICQENQVLRPEQTAPARVRPLRPADPVSPPAAPSVFGVPRVRPNTPAGAAVQLVPLGVGQDYGAMVAIGSCDHIVHAAGLRVHRCCGACVAHAAGLPRRPRGGAGHDRSRTPA